MAEERFDVVVLGARVAGSTLAALLGRGGLKVLLVDRSRFPSDTLSTHFFRGGAFLDVLGTTGALAPVLKLGAPPLRREYLYAAGSVEPQVGPPQSPGAIGYNLSVRRTALDSTLVDVAAGSPQVELALGSNADRVFTDPHRVTGVELEGPNGRRGVRADLVVGADGRNSWLAAAVSAPTESLESGHRGMYYAYFADFSAPVVPADGAEFSVHGDEMAYVFPSDGGVACIALSLNREMFRWCQADPSTRFVSRLVSHHPGIGARLSRARQEGPLRGVGPAPNFVRRPYGPGWALVGDAETHQDPFAGRGIDTAGQHAALLAEEVLRWHREGGAWEDAGRRYAARRDALSREEYDSTVRLSRDLRAFPFE